MSSLSYPILIGISRISLEVFVCSMETVSAITHANSKHRMLSRYALTCASAIMEQAFG